MVIHERKSNLTINITCQFRRFFNSLKNFHSLIHSNPKTPRDIFLEDLAGLWVSMIGKSA